MKKDGKIEAKVRRSVYLDGQCRRFLKGQVCSVLYIYRSLFLRTVRVSKHLSRVYRLAYFWHVFTFDEKHRLRLHFLRVSVDPQCGGSRCYNTCWPSSAVSGLATAAHLSFSGGFNGKRVPLPQCKYILRRI